MRLIYVPQTFAPKQYTAPMQPVTSNAPLPLRAAQPAMPQAKSNFPANVVAVQPGGTQRRFGPPSKTISPQRPNTVQATDVTNPKSSLKPSFQVKVSAASVPIKPPVTSLPSSSLPSSSMASASQIDNNKNLNQASVQPQCTPAEIEAKRQKALEWGIVPSQAKR